MVVNIYKLENFEAKSDEGIFLGYSSSNKTYGVFNKRMLLVKESIHVMTYLLKKKDIINDDVV